MGPEIINFWTNFGTILGTILAPELAPKGDQKRDHFWNPLPPRISGVRMTRFCKLNESAAKATVTGIILGKRKGGINAKKACPYDKIVFALHVAQLVAANEGQY